MTKYEEPDYWKDANYIKWTQESLATFCLSKNDIVTLTEKGLPDWVAPNLNFDNFELERNKLKLGEDREDRDIYIVVDSTRVLVGRNELILNSSPEKLRKALQLYAIMVEKAITADDQAVVENRICDQLIDQFYKELLLLDPPSLLRRSFWLDEIKRLRSHN